MKDREYACWIVGGILAVLFTLLTITSGCQRVYYFTTLKIAEAKAQARVQVASEIKEGLMSKANFRFLALNGETG